MPHFHVRLLKSHDELRECERIQKEVWGTLGVASEVLAVTQKYGGVVLGALAGRRLVGFLYAFLARRQERWIHWSHMMAVKPAFRNRGAGLLMKLAHRRIALEQGISSISWTYDPLQSRNAALNITRLGGRVEEYIPDCYGRFASVIEQGLASDRLVVNWRVASARVERRLQQGPAPVDAATLDLPRANLTCLNQAQLLENRSIDLNLRAARLLIEIPEHTDRMRSEAIQLARRWRIEMRRVFTRYFASGYGVEDFLPPRQTSDSRCFYLLRRGP